VDKQALLAHRAGGVLEPFEGLQEHIAIEAGEVTLDDEGHAATLLPRAVKRNRENFYTLAESRPLAASESYAAPEFE
jgi:hypothetical protein